MVSLGHNELIVRHSQRHFSCTISSRSPLRNDRCGYWAPPQPAPTLPHPPPPNPATTTTTTTPTPSPPDDGVIIRVNGTGVPFTPMMTPSSSTPKLPFLILLHVQKTQSSQTVTLNKTFMYSCDCPLLEHQYMGFTQPMLQTASCCENGWNEKI